MLEAQAKSSVERNEYVTSGPQTGTSRMAGQNALANTLDAAMQCHRAGQIGDAERLYRDVLVRSPGHADAAFLLGVIGMESGRLDLAEQMFTRAATAAPGNASFHSNLGEAQRRLRRATPSIQSFLKAISLDPELVAAVFNLGLLLQDIGAHEGAVACFERAARLRSDLPDVQSRVAASRAAIARRAGDGSQRQARRTPLPEDAFSAAALVGLYALADRDQRPQAVALLVEALRLCPGSAGAGTVLGSVLSDPTRSDDAIAALRAAQEVAPGRPELHSLLGDASYKAGLLDEAVAEYRRAIELRPEDPALVSKLLYVLQYHRAYDAGALLQESRDWERRHVASGMIPIRRDLDRRADRRLCVGYVSADFRQHCQALFLFPLLAHHDHEAFEIVCYSSVSQPDDWTRDLLKHADTSRDIARLSDGDVAARIREDRVDILVDLTMHMEGSRLGVFARKPAPIQITWLAYPGTTGLTAMDYRLTDPHLDPIEDGSSVYAERSLHLPETFWCYHPLTTDASTSPLPALTNGHVTFGCLNNFCKVTGVVVDLWARVMRDVTASKLVLLVPPGDARRRTVSEFEKRGVDGARIEFVGYQPRLPYLATYRRIDLCLDTFPYNGHTTSLDAFWMGVPVVTLVGPTVVGRAGLCQAMNLGLPELVARTPDEYVAIAARLSGDLGRLAEMRAGLRKRIEASPLMDAPRFARSIEAAYRRVWLDFVSTGSRA
jgi:protein O-GlcNAc transferase